jgi:S-adenosylmethionine-dependent methyltransferase
MRRIIMKNILIKLFGKERIKKWYFLLSLILNSKYRKSFQRVNKNFVEINDSKKKKLYKYLSDFYFSSFQDGYLNSDIGKKDMEDHMANRLFNFRHRAIPWIDSLTPLARSKVLEIGCGTGCTTVALAEQGCKLTSIDVNGTHIEAAKKRCELYGLPANILAMNAAEIDRINEKFNLILFSASLEHMTYEERIIALKSAWDMLESGGLLAVIETPNRLYYFDGHSSLLPFYHWLPDQIATRYSKFSPRDACVNSGSDETKFMRFGRGASFHEFEIALDARCGDFEVYSMQAFEKTFISKFILKEYKYNKFLRKLGPSKTPDGFYYENLYLAIIKP